MPNNYPNIGFTTSGRDYNYFQKITVTWSVFGGGNGQNQPDLIIPFSTQGVIIFNEDNSNIVQISFNGQTIHEELNPNITRGFTYDNRTISKIWFQLETGGSAICSVRAWGIR